MLGGRQATVSGTRMCWGGCGEAGHSQQEKDVLGGGRPQSATEGCAGEGAEAGHSQQQKAVQRRVVLASGTPAWSLPVLPQTGARADP